MSQRGFISEGEALVQERLASCCVDKVHLMESSYEDRWTQRGVCVIHTPSFAITQTDKKKEDHYKNDQEFHSKHTDNHI